MALQTATRSLRGELKNLKAEVASRNKSGHSVAASAVNKDNSILVPKFERYGQYHNSTWWSTTYYWSHGVGKIQEKNANTRVWATNQRQKQLQGWEASCSAYHRASGSYGTLLVL